MHIEHQRIIDCSAMTATECSDSCRTALGHSSDFALMANAEDSIVHGSVTVVHYAPPTAHEFVVEVYDTDEAPSAQHKTTFNRPDPMPSEQTIKDRLDAM
jgi:hypothetical protein